MKVDGDERLSLPCHSFPPGHVLTVKRSNGKRTGTKERESNGKGEEMALLFSVPPFIPIIGTERRESSLYLSLHVLSVPSLSSVVDGTERS